MGMTPYSASYRRVVVLLLTTAYTFNSMDRRIVSILAPSIKADLHLTDTQPHRCDPLRLTPKRSLRATENRG
jgi:hypothetical protein